MNDDPVAYGRQVLESEARAVLGLAPLLGDPFRRAVEAVLACRGRVVVTGMGKAGLVGQKISATLASTGTPSLSLHPAEALHGDLGRVTPDDLVVALSNSGETEEILKLIPAVKRIGAKVLALTGKPDSPLARHADLVMCIGEVLEACPIGLAPTTSTTCFLALGDALAMTVSGRRKFTREEFALYHPSGDLGRRLMKTREIMRTGDAHAVVQETMTCLDVLLRINKTRGRPGAACVVDGRGVLVGVVTDGDLVRNLGQSTEFLHHPVSGIMSRDPKVVAADALVSEAAHLLQQHHIDQVPVVDGDRRPVGLLDIQDVLAVGAA
jgi:arabinose-5-phosphate isomerase